ncbi:hypothetical protein ABH19_01575 [Leptospirillum sp. Group II 'CF-1']|nr:hypothetical protein ABH19_01575 [Leptospirillum sp. Group II 'CF-1']
MFITLGFPFAPFHPKTSHTVRVRAHCEASDVTSVRIVSSIDVSKVRVRMGGLIRQGLLGEMCRMVV